MWGQVKHALLLLYYCVTTALLLHVGAAPVPFPLLEHIPRDYGDIMIPTLVVPREDALRLQVKHALLLLYYCFTNALLLLH
jgi:hypothetical protein